MAFAEVGSGSQRATASSSSAVASLNCAFPANVVSGNLLIVAGVQEAAAAPGVTDSLGTSYTVIIDNTLAIHTFIAYGIAPSSGANTVTVTPGASSYMSYAIDEFSGGAAASPLDTDGGASTGASTTPADSITTGVANALIIGVMTQVSTATAITPGGSYTQIGEQEDDTTHDPFNAEFRIATTATSYSVDWTLGASKTWSAQTASFKPAVAGGGLPFFMQQAILEGGMQEF